VEYLKRKPTVSIRTKRVSIILKKKLSRNVTEESIDENLIRNQFKLLFLLGEFNSRKGKEINNEIILRGTNEQ